MLKFFFRQIFYFPILSQINLFIQILENPISQAAETDLALMEVITGCMSRIEYATNGDFKIPFARDLTNIARRAISTARDPSTDMLPPFGLQGYEMSQEQIPCGPSYLEVSSIYQALIVLVLVTYTSSLGIFALDRLGEFGMGISVSSLDRHWSACVVV